MLMSISFSFSVKPFYKKKLENNKQQVKELIKLTAEPKIRGK